MTPELLLQVVSTLMQPMSQGQRYEVLGRITALVMSGHAPVVGSTKQDNPPGYSIAVPPPAAPMQPTGNVIINKGQECMCDLCQKVIYQIGIDVRENMNKKDFVACFLPQNGAPALKMPLDTWADTAGNLAIDCPLCKGDKSLWIKGKGDLPYRDTPQRDDNGRTDTSGGASSI